MAKNVKKSSLLDGLDPQEKEYTGTHTYTSDKTEYTPTITHTPEYTPAHVPTRGSKERKTERLQLSVRPTTKAKLALYAVDHDTSSSEVVQRLLDDLLKDY